MSLNCKYIVGYANGEVFCIISEISEPEVREDQIGVGTVFLISY